jgi:thiamine-monophosphate kinase
MQKHLYPMPRLKIAQWLSANHLATSLMDLSDGLSTDLPRLCAASHVGAILVEKNLPRIKLSAIHSSRFDSTQLALHGGDDYELLFTVAPANLHRVPKNLGSIALTQIGEITTGKQISITTLAGKTKPLSNQGWDPFR